MAFSQEELNIIEYGKANGKTPQEVQSAISRFRSGQVAKNSVKSEKTDLTLGDRLRDLTGDVKGVIRDTKDVINRRGDKLAETLRAHDAGEQSFGESLVQGAANIAMGPVDAAGAAIKGGVKALLTDEQEGKVKEKLGSAMAKVIEMPEVQDVMQEYQRIQTEDPRLARNLGAAGDALQYLLTFVGLKGAKAGGEAAKGAAHVVVDKVDDAARAVGSKVDDVAKAGAAKIDDAVGSLDDVAPSITRIPQRMAANYKAKQAANAAIAKLPTKAAKNAVRDGIEQADVDDLLAIAAKQPNKPIIKEMANVIKTTPKSQVAEKVLETTGKPIVKAIKTLKSQTDDIGKKLGKEATKLGSVTDDELKPAIMNELQRIPGLKNLKINPKGQLDFSDTILLSAADKARRAKIQSYWDEAVAAGTGRSKHLLRQSWFDDLRGAKRSLMNITDTEEKAINAMRGGMLKVLETKNPAYRALSQQFAQRAGPLNKLQDLLRVGAETDDDIVNLAAGILARRVTSHSGSNSTIRMLLRQIDDVVGGGTTEGSTQAAQNVYNILNKYYDLAGGTSFQGQIRNAPLGGRGVTDVVMDAARSLGGETVAVRQRALELFLDDLLKATAAVPK